MKKILSFITLSFAFIAGSAQTIDSVKTAAGPALTCSCCGPLDPAKAPNYLVNDKFVKYDFITLIDPKQIESVVILKNDPNAVNREQTKNGTIVIKMKKDVRWMDLSAVFEKADIKNADRGIPIFFNGKPVTIDSILVDRTKKLTIQIINSLPFEGVKKANVVRYLPINETKR